MAAAIIVAALLVAAALLAVGRVLSERPENHVNPRRRELRRAQAARRRAERTVREVRIALESYEGVLDPVGAALRDQVRALLTAHDQDIEELDR